MKHIDTDILKKMTSEGLVLQGCAGNPEEWISGINDMLTKEGILLDGDTFKDTYAFYHNGLNNILFNMENVKLDIGKLAMWRLASHGTFGGTWLSDYLQNRFGVELGTHGAEHGDADEVRHLPLRAYIENARDERIGGFTIPLPTTPEDLRPFLEQIEINNIKDLQIKEIRSDISGLGEAVTDAIYCSMSPDALSELNYLAAKIDAMQPDELETFSAALEADRHCGRFSELINLAENLDHLYLQPAFTPEQYGEFLLTMDQDLVSGTIEKIKKSNDPNLHDLVSYLEKLESHVDPESYARARAAEENGVFTEYGYLTENDDFKEVYRGPEDIPTECRVVALPEKVPLVKVENTDLTALLLKMHALGGEYMHDAHYNLNTLDNRRSSEYLLLMNERNIFLTEAAHVYRHGTTAHDFLMKTTDSPDTRAYAIHVTEMHDPRGCVIGDILEIDLAERQRDILDHSIHFTRVDATPKFGHDCSYTPEEWNSLEDIDRDMLQSWTRHFEPYDLQAVLRHLEDLREEQDGVGKIVEPNAFLSELSVAYMHKAENPQPDMLRINLDVAKDILSRGGAPVYRLFPEGAVELSALDAMPSRGGLWYQSCREFAIKKEDIGGLDRWANRTADAMIVRWQPDRDAPRKDKSRDAEI